MRKSGVRFVIKLIHFNFLSRMHHWYNSGQIFLYWLKRETVNNLLLSEKPTAILFIR